MGLEIGLVFTMYIFFFKKDRLQRPHHSWADLCGYGTGRLGLKRTGSFIASDGHMCELSFELHPPLPGAAAVPVPRTSFSFLFIRPTSFIGPSWLRRLELAVLLRPIDCTF